jgi:hypothetical protein
MSNLTLFNESYSAAVCDERDENEEWLLGQQVELEEWKKLMKYKKEKKG